MEGNRDEADKCIDIALAALSAGNYERAQKFLQKADFLFPSPRIVDLMSKLKVIRSESTKNANDNAGPKKRPAAQGGTDRTAPEHTPDDDFSQSQIEIVKKIKKCRDYYEVLGITKESTNSEIRKAYKKLALQLHPDKNKAPGSAEAFKAIGNAVAVLTDQEKRKAYDLYGSDDHRVSSTGRSGSFRNSQGQNGSNYEYAYARGFESEVTAEELFNMFFGGGFPPQQNMNSRRYQPRQQEPVQNPTLAYVLILALIAISMMSSFFTSDPIYSLSHSSRYPIERKTSNFRIPYYVKDTFESEYQGSVVRLERSVEEEYIAGMKQACYRERNYRETMMARARSFGSKAQYHQAQSQKTPSCDNLNKIGKFN